MCGRVAFKSVPFRYAAWAYLIAGLSLLELSRQNFIEQENISLVFVLSLFISVAAYFAWKICCQSLEQITIGRLALAALTTNLFVWTALMVLIGTVRTIAGPTLPSLVDLTLWVLTILIATAVGFMPALAGSLIFPSIFLNLLLKPLSNLVARDRANISTNDRLSRHTDELGSISRLLKSGGYASVILILGATLLTFELLGKQPEAWSITLATFRLSYIVVIAFYIWWLPPATCMGSNWHQAAIVSFAFSFLVSVQFVVSLEHTYLAGMGVTRRYQTFVTLFPLIFIVSFVYERWTRSENQ